MLIINWFVGGVQCGIIPDVKQMEFVEAQVQPLSNLNFLARDLQITFQNLLSDAGIHTVTVRNAKHAYLVLLEQLHASSLEFTYS